MKLVLINPGTEANYPPLGLAYIATYLRKYLDFENVVILDANFEDIHKRMKQIKPDIAGITSMTPQYGQAQIIAREIKRDFNIPIIIGGVHISTLPSSMSKVFDVGVIGEGEQTMLELIQLFQTEGGLPQEELRYIKGLAIHHNGDIVTTGKREHIVPLDKIPIPDRSLLHSSYLDNKRTVDGKIQKVAEIITARGCPYHCSFCSTSAFWEKVRLHSTNYVVEEILSLVENYGVQAIQIWDDMFTLYNRRVKELSDALPKKIKKKVAFYCQARANNFDEETCKALRDIGVKVVSFGFESGSDKVLKYLKGGNITIEDNKTAIVLSRKYGFKVTSGLIFGSPCETMTDIKETLDFIDFMKKNRVWGIWPYVLVPFPGTSVWNYAKQRGLVSHDMDWEQLNILDKSTSMFLSEHVDAETYHDILENLKRQLNEYKLKNYIINHPLLSIKHLFEMPKKVELFYKFFLSFPSVKRWLRIHKG